MEIKELPGRLKDLVKGLPELLNNSKAESTVHKYFLGFKKWSEWARTNNIGVFPVSSLHLCLYCSYLVQKGTTAAALSDIFYSVRWAHNVVGVISPTESCLVKNVFEGAKRKLAKPVVKKEIITVDILSNLYDKIFDVNNLLSQRMLAVSLLCYAGFMRSAEVLNLTRSDLRVSSTHMELFIQQSKTDVYRDGSWLLIARTGNRLCPVSNLELYLKLAEISEDSCEFVFRNVTKCGDKYILRKDNKPLLYSRLRECFIENFSKVVQDITKYGLHSFRAGGASAAACGGIPDRLFKRHGRWRSEKAKDGYVKDSLQARLSVSQKLGL